MMLNEIIKDELKTNLLRVISEHTGYSLPVLKLCFEKLGSVDRVILAAHMAQAYKTSILTIVEDMLRMPKEQ